MIIYLGLIHQQQRVFGLLRVTFFLINSLLKSFRFQINSYNYNDYDEHDGKQQSDQDRRQQRRFLAIGLLLLLYGRNEQVGDEDSRTSTLMIDCVDDELERVRLMNIWQLLPKRDEWRGEGWLFGIGQVDAEMVDDSVKCFLIKLIHHLHKPRIPIGHHLQHELLP